MVLPNIWPNRKPLVGPLKPANGQVSVTSYIDPRPSRDEVHFGLSGRDKVACMTPADLAPNFPPPLGPHFEVDCTGHEFSSRQVSQPFLDPSMKLKSK